MKPFDEAEARAGKPVMWVGEKVEYVSGPDINGDVCVLWQGVFKIPDSQTLHMPPEQQTLMLWQSARNPEIVFSNKDRIEHRGYKQLRCVGVTDVRQGETT
jgi:hypothetical protein